LYRDTEEFYRKEAKAAKRFEFREGVASRHYIQLRFLRVFAVKIYGVWNWKYQPSSS